jgi:hypothetical protein
VTTLTGATSSSMMDELAILLWEARPLRACFSRLCELIRGRYAPSPASLFYAMLDVADAIISFTLMTLSAMRLFMSSGPRWKSGMLACRVGLVEFRRKLGFDPSSYWDPILGLSRLCSLGARLFVPSECSRFSGYRNSSPCGEWAAAGSNEGGGPPAGLSECKLGPRLISLLLSAFWTRVMIVILPEGREATI